MIGSRKRRASIIERLFDGLLDRMTPEAREHENQAKIGRLAERAANSEANKRIDDIKRRIHRNKPL